MTNQTSARRPPEQPPVMNFSVPQEQYKTKILGFSGKLGSGKGTMCNFISGLAMCHVVCNQDGQFVARGFDLDEDGKLLLDTGEGLQPFNMQSRQPHEVHWYTWPFIKVYSFAGPLKEFVHTVLNVDEKHLWGTHEEKNEPTHLKWEDMPTAFTEDGKAVGWEEVQTNKKYKSVAIHSGFITGRKILEYFGTSIIRKMYDNAWAGALMKIIARENPVYAIIDDCRFTNEVDAITNAGGDVIRLTRVTEEAAKNTHVSNCELDGYNFTHVVDNHEKDRTDTFNELAAKLHELNWLSIVSQ